MSGRLLLLLAVALGLRLGYALSLDPLAAYSGGAGDTTWYLKWGWVQVSNVGLIELSAAPLYLVLAGLPQLFLSSANAVIFIRVLQALMSTATCYFVYRLGRDIAGDERAGLVSAGALAVAPQVIIEASQTETETTYIFFLTAAIFLTVTLVLENRGWPAFLTVGGLFGLATMTRAASLLFPIGLAGYLLLAFGFRKGLSRTLAVLAMYIALTSIWTTYNLAVHDRFVVGSKGFTAFFYLGTQPEGWESAEQTDIELGLDTAEVRELSDGQGLYIEPDYATGARNAIVGQEFAYLRTRFSDLAGAYLQPFGTTMFSGESVRALGRRWLTEDRSFRGLVALVQADAFWPKLSLYLLHFGGIFLGLVGMWLSRANWRASLPVIGLILYTTLLHLALLALPRYIFPTLPFWWSLGGITAVRIWDACINHARMRYPGFKERPA